MDFSVSLYVNYVDSSVSLYVKYLDSSATLYVKHLNSYDTLYVMYLDSSATLYAKYCIWMLDMRRIRISLLRGEQVFGFVFYAACQGFG